MLNKMRLLTPGPTPLPEVVRLALAQDMIHHRKDQFKTVVENTQAQLKILFGTSSPVLPLACTGTGAMTAAVYSLFKQGEKVLTVEAGKFGERWTQIVNSRGLKTSQLKLPWGQTPTASQIADKLSEDQEIAGVLIQHSETSTGALMPIQEIAEAVQKSNALLIVDGISAVGICPCPMDAWGIDCLLTGSQKGLMLPPGLALLALSPTAWAKAEAMQPGCFYFNLPAERKNIEKHQTNFTSPINLLRGLEASLDFILKDGLQAIYRKQWALTMLARAGAEAMGLTPLVKTNFAWGVTSLLMPEGIDGQKVIKTMQEKFGIVMAGGQDQFKGKITRMGHMGWVDWGDCIAGLCALASALKEQAFTPKSDFVAPALAAYENGLSTWD